MYKNDYKHVNMYHAIPKPDQTQTNHTKGFLRKDLAGPVWLKYYSFNSTQDSSLFLSLKLRRQNGKWKMI